MTIIMYIDIYRGSEIFKTETFGAFSEKIFAHSGSPTLLYRDYHIIINYYNFV